MPAFQLDPRLEADTFTVTELALSSLRLMNDQRWPWLILVPRRAGACELYDLDESDQQKLMGETGLCGRILKQVTNCEKINTAAIGNIVRQLHVHVIARSQSDANWPGPVWGFGTREPYDPKDAQDLIRQVKTAMELT